MTRRLQQVGRRKLDCVVELAAGEHPLPGARLVGDNYQVDAARAANTGPCVVTNMAAHNLCRLAPNSGACR
ncbi:MAG TPA: hypothetical protein VMT68_16385 [Caulobacteraceae bacterium]|nr:hypothetical protein [Caulobacteraceae bacterium]